MQHRVIEIPHTSVLWADHQPESEVLAIRDTTQPHIWETTYQGNPTSPKGQIFEREWWGGMRNRYTDISQVIAIYLSLDTALSDKESAAMSAITVIGLWSDYRVGVLEVWSERVQFPQLISKTLSMATHYHNTTGRLYGVIIENKVSGISLIQSLNQTAPDWLIKLIYPYNPKVIKELRWGEASVWCRLDMVMLPVQSSSMPWLPEFERDLFEAPDVTIRDRLDAFAQGVLFCSNYLSQGYAVRSGRYA